MLLRILYTMTTYKYLIIGGGIAGTTAAETLRKGDAEGSIALVTAEAFPLYSRVLLSKPNFLLEKQPFDSAFMKKAEWYKENNISYFMEKKATALDPKAKTVTFSDGEVFGYEKLLIATGTHTRHWTIPGADKQGIHYLRTILHAKSIIKDLHERGGTIRAVMIGSSCVTFEVAEILHSLGASITEIMREHYFWDPSLSEAEGMISEAKLVEKGVKLIRDTEVVEVIGGERVEGVKLKDGTIIPCDTVFSFIGVTVPTDWLASSGITIERGVRANEYLETSIPDVWAAGDVARFKDVILDDVVMMGNWMNAREQGQVAAENMLGKKRIFEMVSFHSSHGFGDTIGFAGDGRALPDRTYIFRGDPKSTTFGRFIIRGTRLVGASMINRTQELGTIVSLIKQKFEVTGNEAKLADGSFDLKTLLAK